MPVEIHNQRIASGMLARALRCAQEADCAAVVGRYELMADKLQATLTFIHAAMDASGAGYVRRHPAYREALALRARILHELDGRAERIHAAPAPAPAPTT